MPREITVIIDGKGHRAEQPTVTYDWVLERAGDAWLGDERPPVFAYRNARPPFTRGDMCEGMTVAIADGTTFEMKRQGAPDVGASDGASDGA